MHHQDRCLISMRENWQTYLYGCNIYGYVTCVRIPKRKKRKGILPWKTEKAQARSEVQNVQSVKPREKPQVVIKGKNTQASPRRGNTTNYQTGRWVWLFRTICEITWSVCMKKLVKMGINYAHSLEKRKQQITAFQKLHGMHWREFFSFIGK